MRKLIAHKKHTTPMKRQKCKPRKSFEVIVQSTMHYNIFPIQLFFNCIFFVNNDISINRHNEILT